MFFVIISVCVCVCVRVCVCALLCSCYKVLDSFKSVVIGFQGVAMEF